MRLALAITSGINFGIWGSMRDSIPTMDKETGKGGLGLIINSLFHSMQLLFPISVLL